MKPEQAWNDLDLAVKDATEARGYEFLGAEYGLSLPVGVIGKPDMIRFAWHFRIDGKHVMVSHFDVSTEMLEDEAWSTPYIVDTVTDRLTGLTDRPHVAACPHCGGPIDLVTRHDRKPPVRYWQCEWDGRHVSPEEPVPPHNLTGRELDEIAWFGELGHPS